MVRLRPQLFLYAIPLDIHPSWLLTILLIVVAVVGLRPTPGNQGQVVCYELPKP